MVLVHGYASSAAIWRYTLENLSPDRFRVFVLNNRGAGESDRTPVLARYFLFEVNGARMIFLID